MLADGDDGGANGFEVSLGCVERRCERADRPDEIARAVVPANDRIPKAGREAGGGQEAPHPEHSVARATASLLEPGAEGSREVREAERDPVVVGHQRPDEAERVTFLAREQGSLPGKQWNPELWIDEARADDQGGQIPVKT